MTQAFIEQLAPFAVKHGRPAGVLPSLIIAQGIVESDAGKSELAVNARNLFGIKVGSGWNGDTYAKKTAEYVNGMRIEVMADFRVYDTLEGCVIDLVTKYTHGTGWEAHNRYASVLNAVDYKAAVKAVADAGYATDPIYFQKITQAIKRYGLTKYDNEERAAVSLKIALDAGHGMNTPGKRTPDGEREWSFNNKVLLGCWRRLERIPGVQLMRTDDHTGRNDISLAGRVQQANNWGADVFVSLHHNAMSGAWHSGGGTEVYASTNASAKSVQLANSIAPKIAQAMGLKNRGVKRAAFYVIQHTRMPAVLVEGGFMDSRVDIVPMRNDAKLRAQGEAVADAIIATFGLKAPVGDVAHVSKPKPAAKPAPKLAAGGMDYSKYRYGVTLKQGMGGAAVKRFQTDMNTLGYKLATDGSYGPASAAAVRKFQAANRLTVDGIAGVATQAKMTELLAAKKAPAKDKTIYRVIIDGKQVGAYAENDNAIAEARKAIAGGAKNIRIEKV